jgi:hypothetical protein
MKIGIALCNEKDRPLPSDHDVCSPEHQVARVNVEVYCIRASRLRTIADEFFGELGLLLLPYAADRHLPFQQGSLRLWLQAIHYDARSRVHIGAAGLFATENDDATKDAFTAG